MAFPDDRDRKLIRTSSQLLDAAEDLMDWLSQNKLPRQAQDLGQFTIQDEFQLLSLVRRSGNLCRSSGVPVAAAVFGASQVGKSLFVGRVLRPADTRFCPLGRDENLGPPAYFPNLSFDHDLNPQCGDQEATAIATRFTTKDRFEKSVPPKYPVMVRGLSRAEWLRVLVRGYDSECKFPKDIVWQEQQLEKLFADINAAHPAEQVDREWRMDLLDVYSYLQGLASHLFKADESMLNGLISRYPLTDEGYVQVAARLCWNSLPSLTGLFHRVWKFLAMTRQHGREGIVCHWAAVRFLLDSQRQQNLNRPREKDAQGNDKVFPEASFVCWKDLVDRVEDGWYVIDYEPDCGPPKQDLATIQAAMLEMVVPVLPHRLNAEWQQVLEHIDFLDIPGIRNVGRSNEDDAAKTAEKLDDPSHQMRLVLRGKVFYIFERYVEEMQIQTLLLLANGRSLEVRGQLKDYVNQWGRSRFGKDVWPYGVNEELPPFFVGMTGIDVEFEKRPPTSELYTARLRNLVDDPFDEVMKNFGGKGQPFKNIYPIRYPGTWDNDSAKRAMFGAERWETAGRAFLESELVKTHVADAALKWEAAMRDGDGGASLIAAAFRNSTSSLRKQDELTKAITETRISLGNLARGWAVDPNANLDRERRIDSANKVLNWCFADEQLVYARVSALQHVLCFQPGDVVSLADLADMNQGTKQRPEPLDRRLRRELPAFLMEWAKVTTPDRWRTHTAANDHSGEWLKPESLATFSRYLAEYLLTESVLEPLTARLLKVISLQNRDEIARKNARRKFTRLILNDFVMNPGPDVSILGEVGDQKNDCDYGLMTTFVQRWRSRLPEALASAAGLNVGIPAGNSELHEWLTNFKAQFPET